MNFGVLPLTFVNEEDYNPIEQGDILQLDDLRNKVQQSNEFTINVKGKNGSIQVSHALSQRQIDVMLQGGLINLVKEPEESFVNKKISIGGQPPALAL